MEMVEGMSLEDIPLYPLRSNDIPLVRMVGKCEWDRY